MSVQKGYTWIAIAEAAGCECRVDLYAPGTTGNVGWTHKIHGPDTKLKTNSECGDAIFVTGDGNIYVAVANAGGNSVTDYAGKRQRRRRSNPRDRRTMTGLHNPVAIAVNAAGEVFLPNVGNNSITVYAPGGQLFSIARDN